MSTSTSTVTSLAGPSTMRNSVAGLHADTINKATSRGMPYAPFVTKVDDFVGGQDAGVEGIMRSFEEMTAKYRYMEVNLQQKRKGLESKIPDIQKTLDVVVFLEGRRCKRLGTKPTRIPKPNFPDSASAPAPDSDSSPEPAGSSAGSAQLANDAPSTSDSDDADSADELDEAEDEVDGEAGPLKTLYELNDTLFAEAEVEEDGNVGLWLGANTMLMYPLSEAVLLLADKLAIAERSLKNNKEDLEFLREQITVMEVNFARVHNWDVKRRRDLKASESVSGGNEVRSLKDKE